jgi:integrase
MALDDRKFELLLEGAATLGDYYALEAQFVVLVAGRLGLRAGEIVHMRDEWVDWRRRMIVIPGHQSCTKGRDGGICGSCRQSARQKVDHNEGLSIDEALSSMWSPKTTAAAREVPFDADPRAELFVERYFDRFDRFQASQTAVNRRVTAAAEASREVDAAAISPHGLRATAATHFAARGLDVIALQAMFGWAQLSTAHKYIRRSGENTARAIRDIQA